MKFNAALCLTVTLLTLPSGAAQTAPPAAPSTASIANRLPSHPALSKTVTLESRTPIPLTQVLGALSSSVGLTLAARDVPAVTLTPRIKNQPLRLALTALLSAYAPNLQVEIIGGFLILKPRDVPAVTVTPRVTRSYALTTDPGSVVSTLRSLYGDAVLASALEQTVLVRASEEVQRDVAALLSQAGVSGNAPRPTPPKPGATPSSPLPTPVELLDRSYTPPEDGAQFVQALERLYGASAQVLGKVVVVRAPLAVHQKIEALLSTLRSTLNPPSAAPVELLDRSYTPPEDSAEFAQAAQRLYGASAQVLGKVVVVRAPLAVHQKIEALLSTLRSSQAAAPAGVASETASVTVQLSEDRPELRATIKSLFPTVRVDGLGATLVLSGVRAQLEAIKALVLTLDAPQEDSPPEQLYQVGQVPEFLAVLKAFYPEATSSSFGSGVLVRANAETQRRIAALAALTPPLTPPPVATELSSERVYRTSASAEWVKVLNAVYGVKVAEVSGALIVVASDTQHQRISTMLETVNRESGVVTPDAPTVEQVYPSPQAGTLAKALAAALPAANIQALEGAILVIAPQALQLRVANLVQELRELSPNPAPAASDEVRILSNIADPELYKPLLKTAYPALRSESAATSLLLAGPSRDVDAAQALIQDLESRKPRLTAPASAAPSVTQVYAVTPGKAEEYARLLRGLLPSVRLDVSGAVLVISTAPEGHAEVRRLIAEVEAAALSAAKGVTAPPLSPTLSRSYPAPGAATEIKAAVTLEIPDLKFEVYPNLGQALAVGTAAQLEQLEALLARMRAMQQQQNVFVAYELRGQQPEIEAALKTFSKVTYTILPQAGTVLLSGTPDEVSKAGLLLASTNLSPAESAILRTETVPLSYARVTTIFEPLKAGLEGSGARLVAEPRSNAVILSGTPAALQVAKTLLSSLDVALPQVEIRVRIEQIDISSNRTYGIDWSALLGNLSFANGMALAGGDYSKLTAALKLGADQGDNKTLTDTRLLIESGELGTLNSGGAILVPQTASTAGAAPPPPQQINYGLDIELKPVVGRDGVITLDLKTVLGRAVSSGPGNTLNLPSQSLKTKITVAQNGTILLGGIVGNRTARTEEGVPLLMDIPVLGSLFKTTRTERVAQGLLLLITTRVLVPQNTGTANAPFKNLVIENGLISTPEAP